MSLRRGGFQTGGFPDLDLSFLFCPFLSFSGIFPIRSVTVRRFSRFVLFLFLGLLSAPTRNSPERVRDTIWTFPEKSGKHPGLETPRFSFSQFTGNVQGSLGTPILPKPMAPRSNSGKKKEPKLFGLDIFGRGGDLSREWVGAKRFGMSFETH